MSYYHQRLYNSDIQISAKAERCDYQISAIKDKGLGRLKEYLNNWNKSYKLKERWVNLK